MKFYSIIFAALLIASATLRAELNVVASLPDFASIAEEIGGKEVQVTTIARGSEDPHFVDARPSFVRILNKADLLIESGAELEAGWLPTLITAGRNAKIQAGGKGHLALARYVKLLDVPTGPVDRSMGDVHPTGNPHFWLDPRNGKIIAQRIAEKLRELDPKNAAVYDKNLAAFTAKLDEKWTEWQNKLEPLRKTKVITYHKSYEYFAAAFGLEVVAQLEPKPGIEPSATHVAHLVQQAKDAGVKMVIIEPYRPRRSAEQLSSAIGAGLVVLPEKTGAVPEAKDYFSLFDSIVKRLTESAKAQN
jgi:zinc/manganese transport system substrate-binding protein